MADRKMTETEEREFLSTYIYDEYKSVHGIRPRWMDFDAMSIEELRESANRLEQEIIESIAREKVEQEAATIEFEALITQTITTGAGDRETALRWLREAEGEMCDDGFFEYLYGLPYGYLRLGKADPLYA